MKNNTSSFRYLISLIVYIFFLHTNLLATTIETKYFIDKDKSYSIENIHDNIKKFSILKPNKNTFGLSNDTIWLYIKIRNSSKDKLSSVIEFPYPLLDYIRVLEYDNDKLIDSYLTGDLTKFNTRKLISNTFVIPYTLGGGSTKEFILKVNSQGALNLKLHFYEEKEYHYRARYSFMLLGLYYGSVVIMIIYNLFLYFMIKDKVYLNYVLFHVSYLFLQLGFNGIAFEYLWPNQPWINLYYIPEMIIIASYYSVVFSISFLDIQNMHKKIYRYFEKLQYIFIIIGVLVFFVQYNLILKFVIISSSISAISLFVSGIYILVKYKTVSAKFYVTAWSLLLMGVLLLEFQNIGLLPVNIVTLYGSQIGAFLELSLLALALAHRYNTLFVKLKKTEANLISFNEVLEERVQERTMTVNEKNNELSIEVTNKNILLKELFHRVKNNLQIVSGLLSLQSNRIKDDVMKEIYSDTIHRIKSMSIVHEKMYQSDNLEFINMQEYIVSLVDEIKDIFYDNDIVFDVSCEEIHLKIDTLMPLGLILNEIITNSMKYAFCKDFLDQKKISIKMFIDKENDIVAQIKDNGRGIESKSFKAGFGFKLIESLVSYQLKGKVKHVSDNGLFFEIIFKH